MNDEYIKSFRKLPDTQLIERIHVRLERKERRQVIKRYSLLSAFALVFVFGMLMTFSSTVRAYVLQTIEEIAGLKFEITANYPGVPGERVNTVPGERLSLEEAQRRFLAPVALPTYVPQGYARREAVSLTTFDDPDLPLFTTIFLTITWEKEDSALLMLDIRNCPAGLENCGSIVGEGSLEEITLNGNPAILMRGGWNDDIKQYDFSIPLTTLQWKYDENTIYSLITGDQNMSLDELVRIAESIP